MSNKHCCGKCKKSATDPSSPNYAEKVKNKANSKSPYGENEPSPHTTYK